MVIFHSYVSLPEGNFFVAKLRESIIENRKTECREAKNISPRLETCDFWIKNIKNINPPRGLCF